MKNLPLMKKIARTVLAGIVFLSLAPETARAEDNVRYYVHKGDNGWYFNKRVNGGAFENVLRPNGKPFFSRLSVDDIKKGPVKLAEQIAGMTGQKPSDIKDLNIYEGTGYKNHNLEKLRNPQPAPAGSSPSTSGVTRPPASQPRQPPPSPASTGTPSSAAPARQTPESGLSLPPGAAGGVLSTAPGGGTSIDTQTPGPGLSLPPGAAGGVLSTGPDGSTSIDTKSAAPPASAASDSRVMELNSDPMASLTGAAPASIASPAPSGASGSGPFGALTAKMESLFGSLRSLVYILAGFGLIGIGVAAIFGKLSWSWFAGLCAALFLLSGAELIVKHIVGDTTMTASAPPISESVAQAPLRKVYMSPQDITPTARDLDMLGDYPIALKGSGISEGQMAQYLLPVAINNAMHTLYDERYIKKWRDDPAVKAARNNPEAQDTLKQLENLERTYLQNRQAYGKSANNLMKTMDDYRNDWYTTDEKRLPIRRDARQVIDAYEQAMGIAKKRNELVNNLARLK